MKKGEMEAWAVPAQKVISYLKSSEEGLSNEEAKERLKKFGKNEIESSEKFSWIKLLISQFNSPFILILSVATIISYFMGEKVNALVILVMLLMTAFFGFVQEYKAEKTTLELKKYVSVKAKVLRNNNLTEVDSRELVSGDIVYLNMGDIIPADLRLIKVEGLSINESALTGESFPVSKFVAPLNKKFRIIQDLKNIALMGTSVSGGSGYGMVISVGKDTFFGKTAAYTKEEPESDFQKNVKKFSGMILKIIIGMTIFVFVANALLKQEIINSFLFALALAISITPEILPIIMTVALSKGAMKMAKEKVIVKKLSAIENLGNMDILCCDKTGTLTEGKASLNHYLNLDNKKDDKLLLYGLLCNSIPEKNKMFVGDYLDTAIWEDEETPYLKKEVKEYRIIKRGEFDFKKRRMSVVIENSKTNKLKIITKGALESVLKISKYALFGERKLLITPRILSKINNMIAEYEEKGHKIIAVAEKEIKNKESESAEKDFVLVGFLLFTDPPKETVKESLKRYQKLGVEIKIITGDSPIFTKQVCEYINLKISHNKIITGDELEKLNNEELRDYCEKYNIFARINPEQKYKIILALNENSHVVGFLGDGINDAPALKAADIGISVDSGAEIAKDASDIILMKKSLHVIADGISEGRKTFGNLMKYILNTISSNYGNTLTLVASSLFLKFVPLIPSQILLSNFLSDVPDVTISTDNVDEELLKRPKKWEFNSIFRFMVYFGLLSCFFSLALLATLLFVLNVKIEVFRTAFFIEIILFQIIILFSMRTKKLFYKSKPSLLLVAATLITSIITILVTFTSFGNEFFGFVKLPFYIILGVFAFFIIYLISVEMLKKYFFKKFEI